MKNLLNINIKQINKEIINKVQKRLDNLTKPLGSLGELEEIVKIIAGIQGEFIPNVDKKTIVIMCSDNGVVEEGITQSQKEVTSIVMHNFMKGMTGINALANFNGASIKVVDIGVDGDLQDKNIIDKKIRKGTWNIAKGPGMTRNEAIQGINIGIDMVKTLKEDGVKVIGTGEMGIGNTTTSSAIATYITKNSIDVMVGRGAGLSSDGLLRKREVVKKAIEINKGNINDGIDILRCLGGFDIAGMAGLFIGGAIHGVPIIIDGFISAAAALVALDIEPKIKDFILASHFSAEPGTKAIFEYLEMSPYLFMNMRLGEGTGAALFFNIIDAAIFTYKNMGTFDDAKIEQYEPLE